MIIANVVVVLQQIYSALTCTALILSLIPVSSLSMSTDLARAIFRCSCYYTAKVIIWIDKSVGSTSLQVYENKMFKCTCARVVDDYR